ncbi:hypothetical protein B0H13DRAFT_1625741 [Mycena leptocephala]|nr:hypothetical protein B0H13DRAFT_1625741 [Mycena leptocephala]
MHQDERSFILALVAAALVALYFLRPGKNVAPVPPGPKGVRILENVPDLPPSQPWLTFSQWAKNIWSHFNLSILGKSIIILNDVKLATDMLDKESRIYSNRPNLVMGSELMGSDEAPSFREEVVRISSSHGAVSRHSVQNPNRLQQHI